jgi:Flp pilus assembly protein TadB
LIDEHTVAGIATLCAFCSAIAFIGGLAAADSYWQHRTERRKFEHVERMRAMELRSQRELALLGDCQKEEP